MSNRLADEQSPYLLQHKDNPVDWYPWSDEAFDRARREDKPIFLSIGYSTCHWCHVMEHESFEDAEVADLMNDAFVSIKVDREERPDIDGVYMTACQMMTGQGGWPLTVIMTPDRRPFHVATYIPKSSRFGRMGMVDLVPKIKEVWTNRREDVLSTAGQITETLQRSAQVAPGDETVGEQALHQGYRSLRERFDEEHGGFGSAPKFPSPHNLLFLLRYGARTGEADALLMVEKTLERMRRGGIFDHVGYGFHRYSTDGIWLLPHFEKMLYDQALLAAAYTEAYQATGRREFRATAAEIFEYVRRDMQSPEGAFYSAEDADSEGREGKFYVWTIEEIESLLPAEDARRLIETYQLETEGNFEEEATRRRTGENILHLSRPAAEAINDPQLRRSLTVLFEARERRVRPGRDDKILTDWNGLMIGALSKAAAAFGEADLGEEARRAADFVLTRLRDEDGRLIHRYRNGEAAILGLLDDYAYLIWGLTELYQAVFDTKYLREALALQSDMLDRFWDDTSGGFFMTPVDGEELIMRQKEFHDGAMPSGNAIALLNLARLSRMTGSTELEDRANGLARAASVGLSRMPAGFTGLLSGLDFALGPASEIVIAGGKDSEETQRLIDVIREGYRPNQVVLFKHEEAENLAQLAPFTAAQEAADGRVAVFVCRDFRCETPWHSAAELRAALERSD